MWDKIKNTMHYIFTSPQTLAKNIYGSILEYREYNNWRKDKDIYLQESYKVGLHREIINQAQITYDPNNANIEYHKIMLEQHEKISKDLTKQFVVLKKDLWVIFQKERRNLLKEYANGLNFIERDRVDIIKTRINILESLNDQGELHKQVAVLQDALDTAKSEYETTVNGMADHYQNFMYLKGHELETVSTNFALYKQKAKIQNKTLSQEPLYYLYLKNIFICIYGSRIHRIFFV